MSKLGTISELKFSASPGRWRAVGRKVYTVIDHSSKLVAVFQTPQDADYVASLVNAWPKFEEAFGKIQTIEECLAAITALLQE